MSRKHAEVERRPRAWCCATWAAPTARRSMASRWARRRWCCSPGDIVAFGVVELVLEAASGLPLRRTARRRACPRAARRGAARGGCAGRWCPARASGCWWWPPAWWDCCWWRASSRRPPRAARQGPARRPRPEAVPAAPRPGGAGAGAAQPVPLLLVHGAGQRARLGQGRGGLLQGAGRSIRSTPRPTALMRRIKLEKEAAELLRAGREGAGAAKEDEALDSFKKIPKESAYFRRAKPKVQEAVAQVVKRSEDDCKRYLRDAQWAPAVPRCDRYMGFACQKMSREELEPPIGYTLVLDAKKRLGRNEWRPKDKLYLDFLIARKRMEPNAAPWHCPVSDIFCEDEAAPDPEKLVEDGLQAAPAQQVHGRGDDGLLGRARERGVRHPAEAALATTSMAQFHAEADKLLTRREQRGSALQARPDAAAERGRGEGRRAAAGGAGRGQAADGRSGRVPAVLLPAQHPAGHGRQGHRGGKYWDERGDQRRACRIWKLGFRFYAGNTDLNSQVGRCSTRGLKAFKDGRGRARIWTRCWTSPSRVTGWRRRWPP